MEFNKNKVAVWCYNEWKIEEVNQSIKDFRIGVRCCEGSEQERYSNILCDLLDIKEKTLEELKENGWRFYKKGDTYYPVASDQEEWGMKKEDIATFENAAIR